MSRCSGCTKRVFPEDECFCDIDQCGDIICHRCIDDNVCFYCGRDACDTCIVRNRDGELGCVECVTECDLCNENDLEHYLQSCDKCHKMVCIDCHTEYDDGVYCDDCRVDPKVAELEKVRAATRESFYKMIGERAQKKPKTTPEPVAAC
jgi:hypothetical protein